MESTQSPAAGSKDVPVQVIVIVGCVCGVVVITLSIILVILLCKRNEMKRKYKQTRGAAIIFSAVNDAKLNGGTHGDVHIENQAVDGSIELAHANNTKQHGEVFATTLSAYPVNNNDTQWSTMKVEPDVLPVGVNGGMRSPATSSSGSAERPTTLALMPHRADSGYGESLADQSDRYCKDRYHKDRHAIPYHNACLNYSSEHNTSAGSTAGYPPKPKRIIHEVVV